MKTENTLENKAKFFALYYGQKVLCTSLYGTVLNGFWLDKIMDGSCDSEIQLKPLESISDEDAAQCWVNDNYIPKSEDIKFVANLFNPITAINADYLRSKGYALPWMDLSIQDLIDYGWIKLSEQ